jgi:Fic family protein
MAIPRYNWEQADWPNFTYKKVEIKSLFSLLEDKQSPINILKNTTENEEDLLTILDVLTVEVQKTSAIEGEFYSKKDVISSIKKKLGIPQKNYNLQNKLAANISNFIVASRESFAEPLSKVMLCKWHSILFENYKDIEIGNWRTHKEAMQVISGAFGKQKIHFEAPASNALPAEMKSFIAWFNDTAPNGNKPIKNVVIRAAVAHLYFLSIHPFEDGNGRIGRALAEKVFSQHSNKPVLLSLSYAFEKEKKAYYGALQKAQQHNDITAWLKYFIHTVYKAKVFTEKQIQFALKKQQFEQKWKATINSRQLKVIHKMLDSGFEGFEGGMNAQKYIGITKASKATATRDLQELQALKIFKQKGAGRSTSYGLVL